jgi:hypothetical protein
VSNGHGEKRSRREEAAIAALLSEPTVEAAAAKAGIGFATLRRWLQEPGFRRLYQQARAGLLERVVATLLRLSTSAIVALGRNLTCGRPSVEVRAAEAILTQATRGVELLDLAERVEQLEQAAKARHT